MIEMKPRTNPNRLWICFDRVRCTIACKSATAYESEIIPFDGKILTPATTENFSSRLCEIQRLGINSGHSAWPPWSRKRQARAQCSNRWAPRSKDTALCSLHHASAQKQRWTADFGDVAADIVRSAAKSQVITNNLNEEVNTWKERYDGSTAK